MNAPTVEIMSCSKPILFLAYLLPLFAISAPDHPTITVHIEDRATEHQGMNTLDIDLYLYPGENTLIEEKVLPKVRAVVDTFFGSYPNETDYWEVVNRKLSKMVLGTITKIDSMRSCITIDWKSGAGWEYGHHYPTRSYLFRNRDSVIEEGFGFLLKDYPIHDSSLSVKGMENPFTLKVSYRYEKGLQGKEFPDGLGVEKRFRTNLHSSSGTLETILRTASKEIMKKYHKIERVSVHVRLGSGDNIEYLFEP